MLPMEIGALEWTQLEFHGLKIRGRLFTRRKMNGCWTVTVFTCLVYIDFAVYEIPPGLRSGPSTSSSLLTPCSDPFTYSGISPASENKIWALFQSVFPWKSCFFTAPVQFDFGPHIPIKLFLEPSQLRVLIIHRGYLAHSWSPCGLQVLKHWLVSTFWNSPSLTFHHRLPKLISLLSFSSFLWVSLLPPVTKWLCFSGILLLSLILSSLKAFFLDKQ